MALGHVGCSSRSVTNRGEAAPAPATAPQAPAPAAPAPEGPAGWGLRSLEAPTYLPATFRITSPGPAQPVPLAEASQLEVVLEGPREGVRLALDGHAFRPSRDRVTLGDLLLEDEELAPGPHRLVALRDEPAGRLVTATWFWVHEGAEDEASVPEAPPRAGVVLVAPRGTYNGPQAADAVQIDAFALAPFRRTSAASPIDQGAILRAQVEGPEGSLAGTTQGEPLALLRLGSGDHRVEVRRIAPRGDAPRDDAPRDDEGPWDVVSRVITVNRDASPPEER